MNELELQVWQRVAGLAQSPSHDFHHIARVQAYADALGRALGANTDLVRLAAILHDLGRGDQARRHGLPSIEASKELAEGILRHLELSSEDRRSVIEAIESHDQPDLSPQSVASRILKDSDFLAGFGAWGVLRIAMWSGETGRRLEQVLEALTNGMQRRLESLEFQESRDAAMREILFARQFHAELERPVRLGRDVAPGFYCVIEGISGGGKNTLAASLLTALATGNYVHQLVEEPSTKYREMRRLFSDGTDEFVPLRKALLVADRAQQFATVVRPALDRGDVVVSVRSFLSTAVYQSSDRADAYRTLIEHDWLPPCDLLILLDLDVDAALERIQSRDKPGGDFETREQLTVHRGMYRELVSSFPSKHTVVIDASRPMAAVAEEATQVLLRRLESRRGSP